MIKINSNRSWWKEGEAKWDWDLIVIMIDVVHFQNALFS